MNKSEVNLKHINVSFGTEEKHIKKRPLIFYIAILLGIFIFLNAFLIALLFFR